MVAILSLMSLVVVLSVTWNLRQTGVALANDASCGHKEHQHTDECPMEKVLICGYNSAESMDPPTEETTEPVTEETTEPSVEETTAPAVEEATEPSEEETTAPTVEETTEPTAEETTEPSVEETTAPTVEETTEPPVVETTEAPMAALVETPSEEKTQPETPMDVVMNVAAKVLSEIIPAAQAAEIPVEETVSEHVHTDACYEIIWLCGLEEHLHELSCYSDTTADLEDWDIWAASIPELTGWISDDIVLVAQSQLGNKESTLNFELAEDGETRNGISRYGQWYGNPYGPWSNMFTSFCLRYAGLAKVPINSGAEKMRIEWEELELYRHAGGYEPVSGDIVFLDKNQNGTAESTAVVVRYFDFILTVIEGDVDNAVVQKEYRIDDPVIVGYGMTNPAGSLMVAAPFALRESVVIGQTMSYKKETVEKGGDFILYTVDNGKYYAIDGNGYAQEIEISTAGVITATISDQDLLYWNFKKNTANYETKPTYVIQNRSTGMYLHPYKDNDTTYGVLHRQNWTTALYETGTQVRLRGVNQYQYAQLQGDHFGIVDNQNSGSIFSFGKAPTPVNLWLDGTNGDLIAYRGSENTKYSVISGNEVQLPSQWKSPTKYHYVLAGWVDIKTGDYYLPESTITVTEDTVLYADWVADTYDVGEFNSYVADTMSTNDFITTYVFDYNSLINLNSAKVSVTMSDDSHSETWSHVSSGSVTYKGKETLNFAFDDQDGDGALASLKNANDPNKYTGGTAVYSGIYNSALGNALFGIDNLFNPETGEGIVGKHYLGQGDHLFQINTDPTSKYYGYYYYDAKLNAASYNQTDQRFYVYDYLARTSDSANNNDAGKYSDFLPLNSPYANTNGQTVKTYSYAGDNGEYNGVSHYVYDVSYNSGSTASNQIRANLWFGMRTDVQFGLPDTPGTVLPNGEYGNKDIYGNDMHFHFTGDDDVWILVDGVVALDLGGIHQAAEGDINFSTGEVRVNGKSVGKLSGITAGEHVLSILYLERGSSMSNCAIYFNLAPRFSLTLAKEDVLTQEKLNGAQFGVYNDQACTSPCNLWTSQQSYKNGDEPTNQFTITNGQASIWGLSPSRVYYLREETPPTFNDGKEHHANEQYSAAKGVIQLTLDKNGLNSYSATILKENGQEISHGFTIHGFRIDEENQAAYITITNAQNWVEQTTSVYVEKKWNDAEDHTYDAVTVYLNVTDPDGTVRRIREVSLSEENDWKYTWTNLPKYSQKSDTLTENKEKPIVYSVSEAYIPGYTNQVTELVSGTYTEVTWKESSKFENGGTYVLKTANGCLSAVSEDETTLCLVDEATARTSDLALWKVLVSGDNIRLTNLSGQSLRYYTSGRTTRYFDLSIDTTSSNTLSLKTNNNKRYLASGNYYLCAINKNGYADAKDKISSALAFQLMQKNDTTTTLTLDGLGYSITNIPLSTETSLKVTKHWDHPNQDASIFEKEQVTIKLLANGVDTGRTETVSLKSNWTAVFNGLPYVDEEGDPISYTVEESWNNFDWTPTYGAITTSSGDVPTYETSITNTYRWTEEFELPSTGGIGYPILIFSGMILALAPLVYGLRQRRRYRKEARR